jgi:DNA-directed RNA polymerase alpha subunit
MPSTRIVTSTSPRHQDTGGGMVADGSTTGDDEALAAPLSVLGLSIRASNALLNNGFSTVGDVVALTEVEVWQLPGVGPGTLMEIKAKLSARYLTLRPGGPPLPKRK